MPSITIQDVASHRNGVAGEGFHVVLFTLRADGMRRRMVGTVFDGDGRVAVLSVDQLAAGDIAFGSNSWRAEAFEPALRAAVSAFEEGRDAEWRAAAERREALAREEADLRQREATLLRRIALAKRAAHTRNHGRTAVRRRAEAVERWRRADVAYDKVRTRLVIIAEEIARLHQ